MSISVACDVNSSNEYLYRHFRSNFMYTKSFSIDDITIQIHIVIKDY
jgi:hypothetical protein